jgi:hypothetical protein
MLSFAHKIVRSTSKAPRLLRGVKVHLEKEAPSHVKLPEISRLGKRSSLLGTSGVVQVQAPESLLINCSNL